MRRTLPVAVTAFFGVLYILSDGLRTMNPTIDGIRSNLDLWNNVSGAFAVLLTCISLTMVHARNLRRSDRALYSGTLLGSMYFMIVLGIITGSQAQLYKMLFDNTAGVLEGVVLSCVCFYIVSASYRVFKVRSAEAAIMMTATILVMLSNVSIGEAIHEQIPLIGRWLMDIPNSAAMRAITIGATLGSAATAVRMLVGIERTHLGGE